MTWPCEYDENRLTLHVEGRIAPEDAARQEATVRAILARLERQPGVVLADEVGMGKTFVALAIAASAAWGDRDRRPVVVMVPSSLREKWPRDFETFRARCLRRPRVRTDRTLRAHSASNGIEFFRLLDDPRSRRAHLIFLTHGALHGALSDPWMKLAILKKALRPSHLAARKRALPRFAGRILRCASRYKDVDLFARLLAAPHSRWRRILMDFGDDLGDDPIPEAISRVLNQGTVDLGDLQAKLGALPLRNSKHITDRIRDVRRSLGSAMQGVWHQALVEAEFRSPLLIMDEAHHLKNARTRLASLFVAPEASGDARVLEGALHGGFERMLFLTATPFQLGHHELLSVLSRFRDIYWKPNSPTMSAEQYEGQLAELERRLDAAHVASRQLDQRWSRLGYDELGQDQPDESAIEDWWTAVEADPGAQRERVQSLWDSYRRTLEAMRSAEASLRPWVVRHMRNRRLPGAEADRRKLLRGAAIAGGPTEVDQGLAVRGDSLLPFLLAARSQAVVACGAQRHQDAVARRMTFADGLASSYEAFLQTRAMTLGLRTDERAVDEDTASELYRPARSASGTVSWYLDRLKAALPGETAYVTHPKVGPTVDRACELWEQREKVLIFCHYRATGSALVRHLSETLARRIERLGAQRLHCASSDVARQLELLGDRFEPGRPLHRNLEKVVHDLCAGYAALSKREAGQIFDVVRRFVRTPSFLVRYMPLEEADPNRSFQRALETPDGSGLSLFDKVQGFVEFLAQRCEPQLRAEYLAAMERIRTGVYAGELQPVVRRAAGADDAETRRTALLGFNTPFFPEVLVASSVLAEGVDLHLDCRHIIHHDLDWNPSTLEQRTGRIDRIGAKAERVGKSIQVYLPFLAETQDEKMYRVVRDRERWFQVLMGEDYQIDELAQDAVARRVPLPQSAAAALAFRLEVWDGTRVS